MLRGLKYIAITYFLAAFAFTIYAVGHYPTVHLADLVFDDAYYYLGVAWNIAQGHGSTFGNLVQTNGYQPLWLLILAAVLAVFSLSKVWALAVVPLLTLLIKIVAVARIDVRKSAEGAAFFIALVAILLLCQNTFMHGLETILLLLFLPLISQLKPYPEQFSPATCVKYAAIFLVLFLARLDALALAGAFALLVVISRRKHVVSNLALTLGLTLAGVLVYFAVNYTLLGTIVPVSGQAKAIGNRVGENLPVLLNYLLAGRIAIAAIILVFILKAGVRKNAIGPLPFSGELKLIALGTVAIASYYALFSGWPVWGWYYWPVALVTLYALTQVGYLSMVLYKQSMSSWTSKLLSVVGWGFIGYVLLLGVRTEMAHDANPFYSMLKKTSDQSFNAMNVRLIDDFFSKMPDGVVAMGDRAGGLGYWLPERFKFFHTEGLVANKEYIDARKAGTGLQFLKGMGIKYFVVERERLLEARDKDGTVVHGIVEPVQGLSVHSGQLLICLPESSILYSQDYGQQIRRVYDFTKLVECPNEIRNEADRLSQAYGELRKYSLPSEYGENWTLMKYIKSNPF
ncbi:hypothetical protein [Noviherbaspirillum massiliense]|uniref:hypothetical protein n=1 Tax=Noviherbaspirillum massiliense TaxID=1465823 RepID=UPI0002FD7A9B|nr:hypothetical protein [Noviherbaspirillum massiliense]